MSAVSCTSVSTDGHTFIDDARKPLPYRALSGEVRRWQVCTGCGNVQNRAVNDAPETDVIVWSVVPVSTFRKAFEQAREESSAIADATSPFEHVACTMYVLSHDGRSGYALRPDMELVYVFSLERGRGDRLVNHAVTYGAARLDCFDGYLPSLYARHGFREVSREPNWTPGGPDVVYMRHHFA